MTTNPEREALRRRLQDKEHREAFVSAIVDQTIPFQIRALRLAKHRNWTQKELAQHAGMKQERISVCENPNYGNFSLRTLKQLAAVFDVGLIVRFAPFSDLVEWEVAMSNESLEVPSFEQEDYFKKSPTVDSASSLLEKYYSKSASSQVSSRPNTLKVISFQKGRKDDSSQQIPQEATILENINEIAFG
jgi:transcriptional regulator with XRE-family HTH domain